jgi:EmrB/QacA subfamily drug resistance transporter
MVLIDETVVGVALPTIAQDLGLSPVDSQWVVNAYLLALAALMMVGGRLSDLIGLLPAFLAGLSVFTLGSAAAGLADGDLALIVSRAVQGIGGALMIPSSLAIVINSFPLEMRGRALGTYSGFGVAALSAGPPLGGLLTDVVSWRVIFWINVPIAIAVLVIAAMAVRLPRVPSHRRGIDMVGLALLIPGLMAIVLGIMQAEVWGWGSLATWALIAGGIALLAVFARVETRRPDPLIEVTLFKRRAFTGGSLGLLCAQFVGVSVSVYGAIYLQQHLGFSALIAGVALIPAMAPSTVMSYIGGRWVDRVGPRLPTLAGVLGSAVGFALMTLGTAIDSYPVLFVAFLVFAIGIPLVFLASTAAAVGAVDERQRGEASGVAQTCQQFGATLGIAVLGAILLVGAEEVTFPVLFAVCGAIMLAAVPVALRLLPETPARAAADEAAPAFGGGT